MLPALWLVAEQPTVETSLPAITASPPPGGPIARFHRRANEAFFLTVVGTPGADRATLDFLGLHSDCTAGAFGGTDAAALAVVVIDAVAVAGTELDDGVVGAYAVGLKS